MLTGGSRPYFSESDDSEFPGLRAPGIRVTRGEAELTGAPGVGIEVVSVDPSFLRCVDSMDDAAKIPEQCVSFPYLQQARREFADNGLEQEHRPQCDGNRQSLTWPNPFFLQVFDAVPNRCM